MRNQIVVLYRKDGKLRHKYVDFEAEIADVIVIPNQGEDGGMIVKLNNGEVSQISLEVEPEDLDNYKVQVKGGTYKVSFE